MEKICSSKTTWRDDPACGKVVAAVPFVFQWITEKDTRGRTRGEFVVHGCIKVWKAKTAKYAEVRIFRLHAMEEVVGCVRCDGTRGSPVEKIGSSV